MGYLGRAAVGKKAVITWREEMRVALATINKSTKRESPLLTFVRSCGRTEIVGKRGELCVEHVG